MLPYESAAAAKRESPNDHMADLIKQQMGGQKYLQGQLTEISMPIINRIAEFHREMTEWRHDLHAHPELALQETRTSGVVQAKLKAFGVDEIITGMARTGVVGVIRGHGASDRAIGLRADMDALPILEETGLPYASQNPGVMHACGHDGHTTMLLGAAKYLAETRNFDGTVYVIFQPAEENLAGGEIMVKEGLFERCPMEHGVRHAQLAADAGGHFRLARRPDHGGGGQHRDHHHRQGHPRRACRTSASIRSWSPARSSPRCRRIVSRTIEPIEGGVVTIGHINGGHTYNVIPETVRMLGTARWFAPARRRSAGAGVRRLATGIAESFGAKAEVVFDRAYPATVNDPDATALTRRAAAAVAGRGTREADAEADHGRRGFRLHAERQAGQLHHAGRRPRQGRRDGPPPALRLQRRDPADRRIVLGDAGRAAAAARGMTIQRSFASRRS